MKTIVLMAGILVGVVAIGCSEKRREVTRETTEATTQPAANTANPPTTQETNRPVMQEENPAATQAVRGPATQVAVGGAARGSSKENAAQRPGATVATGGLRWQFAKGSENWDPKIRDRIAKSMDEAVAIYNANGSFNKVLTANYSSSVKTADGSNSGWINFGHSFGTRTAMHEIAHTLGVGTHWKWKYRVKDGLWTGEHANALVKAFGGPEAKLHADRAHFWPYGLNYASEKGPDLLARHVKMVVALRKDMGMK